MTGAAGTALTGPVPTRTLRRVVELATRAPSVHNTQPWRWRATGDGLELYADRDRQLRVTDPDGRNLVISCGTALHHAQVAADALGWPVTELRLLPDPAQPDLLARLRLGRGAPSPEAGELLDALDRRCTDRRRFTSWPVPDERLDHLASRAEAAGARALALHDVTLRFRAEWQINRAIALQRTAGSVREELLEWVDHGDRDGIPTTVLPAASPTARPPSRFPDGLLEDFGDRDVEGSDGLLVLVDAHDDPAAWLRAGAGLSALWLAATIDGLSVVPLSQVVEVAETRAAFRDEVLGGLAVPLVVVRVGWQAISRRDLPRTPRRPVDDVLERA